MPFVLVFLASYTEFSVDRFDSNSISPENLLTVEAETYICLKKLHEGQFERFGNEGLVSMIKRLKSMIAIVDPELYLYMEKEGIEFEFFAYRWIICLLSRELSMHSLIRVWDRLLIEGDQLPNFCLCLCTALLCHFSSHIKTLKFSEMLLYLQDLPSKIWTIPQVETLMENADIINQVHMTLSNRIEDTLTNIILPTRDLLLILTAIAIQVDNNENNISSLINGKETL